MRLSPALSVRTAETTSEPLRQWASIAGSSSGGSWRSPSSIATALPSACSSPAVSAAWWPKLRARWRTRTRGSASASESSSAGVRSELASSTRISSNGTPSSALRTRRNSSPTVSSSSRSGTTTLSRSSLRSATERTLDASLGSRPPMDASIFKAYDVRGVYGEQLDPDAAYRIGRAFARVLSDEEGKPVGELTIGLGRDMRLTAPEMAARYADDIRDEGADVIDVGMVGTEMLYFAVGSHDLDGGVMCTASHNPRQYTGAKLVKRGAIALSGDAGIAEVGRLASGELAEPAGERGSLTEEDIADEFRRAALKFIEPSEVSPRKVVLDGGNGMAGPMVGPLLDELPIEQVATYWEPDGEFPDHEPNPLLPENRTFIVKKVLSEGAELGIAWDGDADRCFFIDDTGQFVDGDFLTALLAVSILEKQPGAKILYDVRASRAVPDLVSEAGGTALMNRVGHAFFKVRMREEGAAFGGEVSGHYYFHDFYNADSGTIPALLILELLSKKGRRISELLAPLRSKYFISGEINSEVADGAAKMRELEERYSDAKITHVDGVSVDYDDWHFNVRPSNTEPLLRLTLESLVSPEDMERRRDEVLGVIRG